MRKGSFISSGMMAVTLIGFLVLGQSCHRKTITTTSKWQAAPPQNASDWAGIPRFYDKSTKLSYDVANDGTNLYIFVKAVDRDLQIKILRTGFNIWLDTTGKKKEVLGARFPLPASERIMQGRSGTGDHAQWQGQHQGNGQKPDMAKMRENMTQHIQEMDLIGLAEGKSTRTTAKNSYGVTASLDMDDAGVLYYQLSVPLKSIFGNVSPDALPTKHLMIGLETNKVEAPTNTHGPNDSERGGEGMGDDSSPVGGGGYGSGGYGGGGIGGSGSGGFGGGMHGGGYGGGMPQGASTNFDTQVNIWTGFVLANSQTTLPTSGK